MTAFASTDPADLVRPGFRSKSCIVCDVGSPGILSIQARKRVLGGGGHDRGKGRKLRGVRRIRERLPYAQGEVRGGEPRKGGLIQ